MLSGGEQRITLPAIIYLLLLWTPASFLFALIVIPEHRVNRAIKQILATPLLAVQFLLPFAIASESKGLFLVDPLVEENPAYTTVKNLWIEFWSCMREFPEVAIKNGKTSKAKEYTKDRSFYHIILLLFLELLTLDVVATWITSFSSREINALATERPMLFFIFFVAANILLTSTFNSIGYALQLFYCIFIEGGSYSSGNYKIQIRVFTMQATVVKRWFIRSTIAHKLIGHIWTVAFGYFTFYYIMNGFISSEFYAENPIRFLNPYILRIVRETPALRPYFGSYIY
ncbi:hypothetical protein BCV71DRAFT_173653 [Rhizopus microsporus]|uniref:Uncharacterized protein n=1 Tax=Rhizopus microsporus TaxID=58291 RepID=A0A1X0SBB4_RHIZD|nr:hypothetical protein BCV71DRAFT_173653 [Rhizopus microsporus]